MRGTIIFALATLVVPALTAAVSLIDTPSLNVEPDVKRHTEFLNAEQAKRITGTERLPILDRAVLAERGKGAIVGDAKRISQETTEELVQRGGKIHYSNGGRDLKSPEGLVERGGKIHYSNGGRDLKSTGSLVE